MSKTTLIEQIKGDLGYLKLTRTEEVFAQLAEEARTSKEDPLEFLAKVIASEVDATRQRRLSARLRFAHFPFRKTLEEFDFDFQPSIDPKVVLDLAELDFVRDGPLDVRSVTPAMVVDRALVDLPKDRIHVDLSRAPGTLHVDAERTSLALRNLLQNAVQATPDGGEPVEVRIGKERREIVIEVRDHGPGLAPGAEAQIFDPFVTTKTRGTGLGLSIARRIAEQHDGTLTGETHGEGGALFRLVLPLESKPE